MFKVISNWLYDFITWTGIIIRLMPILQPIIHRLLLKSDTSNFKVIDKGGASISVTKYNGRIYPPFGVDRLSNVRNLTVRKDDVMLCGYPKTGCHWVYEIMYMLLSGKPELTKHGKEVGGMIDAIPPIILDSVASPRILNSHLLYEELPVQTKERKTKIVWTVRSPKDTVVSFYNHNKNVHVYQYDGSFDDYFQLFMEGKLEYGSYFNFILSWEKAMKTQKDNPILVVEYERLKENPLQAVKEIARFLNLSITDKFAEALLQECDFNRMKEKRSNAGVVAHLFRKGQVGDWRNWLTDAQSSQIDQVWRTRMAKCFYQPQL